MHGDGGCVRTIMMDMEFEKIKEQEGMEVVDVNTTAAREHVGEIEHGIRYLKERRSAAASVHLPLQPSSPLQSQS